MDIGGVCKIVVLKCMIVASSDSKKEKPKKSLIKLSNVTLSNKWVLKIHGAIIEKRWFSSVLGITFGGTKYHLIKNQMSFVEPHAQSLLALDKWN